MPSPGIGREKSREDGICFLSRVLRPGKMIGAFGGDLGSVSGLDPSGMPSGASDVNHETGNKLV